MEFAMAPVEALDQMPMRVPIGNLGQQVPMQQLNQQQQQLLQQQLLNQQNQQHLQNLLALQQQCMQQSGQMQPQASQQQVAQMPNLLTSRGVLDPMTVAALGMCKAPTLSGLAVTSMPSVGPWLYPMVDSSILGAGMMPTMLPSVPFSGLQGAGVPALAHVEAASQLPISTETFALPGGGAAGESTSESQPTTAQAKRRGQRIRVKKDTLADAVHSGAASGPLAVGELVGAAAVDALAEVRREGPKSPVLLREVMSNVAELALDPEGSRFLQAKLESQSTDLIQCLGKLSEFPSSIAPDASGKCEGCLKEASKFCGKNGKR